MRSSLPYRNDLLIIMHKCMNNQPLTAEETGMLDAWLQASPHNELAWKEMQQEDWLKQNLRQFDQLDHDSIWQKTLLHRNIQDTAAPVVPIRNSWYKYVAVAAVMTMVAIGTYFWFNSSGNIQSELASTAPSVQENALPGKDGAILTLDDGTTVVLDNLGNGVIASQNGTQVMLSNGELIYDATAAAKVSYNTMTTPRGRQFQLVLPDGSKVWLNAGSSVRYPSAFLGNERVVEVTGEAYFEVTHNKDMPFRVNVDGISQIEVLGTSFNINAYSNESAIYTTLFEGAVQLYSGNKKALLKPGQQAEISRVNVNKLQVSEAKNISDIIAWKNGLFSFRGTDLKNVMRQIERWYDLEVTYEGKIPDISLTGEISRKVNLSEILAMLKYKEIPFSINGKLVVIGKK